MHIIAAFRALTVDDGSGMRSNMQRGLGPSQSIMNMITAWCKCVGGTRSHQIYNSMSDFFRLGLFRASYGADKGGGDDDCSWCVPFKAYESILYTTVIDLSEHTQSIICQ